MSLPRISSVYPLLAIEGGCITVEGEQLAREIAPFIIKKIDKRKVPLMTNLFKAILKNKKLKIK